MEDEVKFIERRNWTCGEYEIKEGFQFSIFFKREAIAVKTNIAEAKEFVREDIKRRESIKEAVEAKAFIDSFFAKHYGI